VGWLTGPKPEPASKQVAVVDGRQGFMSIPSGTGAGGPNLSGMIEQDGSFANYANVGYGRNELVYACIRYRAESLPQSVIRVYPWGASPTPAGNGPAIDDHRLRRLFEAPNPVTDEFEFLELSVTYKDLAGTCFWLVVNGRDGLPTQLWPVRPDLVGVLPNPRDPADYVWVYRPDPERPEIMVPVPDAGSPRAKGAETSMIRIRYPNPNPHNPAARYFGQPPLRPAARATTLDNAATDFVDTLLRNHAMPAVVIETESEITDTLHKRLRAKWREAFSGSNRGAPAFLQKGMKIHQMVYNLTDLEFPDLREVSEARVCMAFGVEPILIGTKLGLTHNAYKDYREARLSFWEEAMFSEQRRFIEPVRSRLLPRFAGVGRRRVMAAWDNSGVLALKEAAGALWQRGTEALARGGITRNDFRQMVGLAAVPGGDVFLTPSGVVPQEIGQAPAAPAEDIEASAVLLAAEYGVELSRDEVAGLQAREGSDRGW
jgi:HK97 family phage portal protein